MKRLSLIAAGLLAGIFGTAAQTSGATLTLDECRQMALESNAAVRTARGREGEAEEVRREAFTKYFPTVSAQGMYWRSNKGLFQYDILDIVTIEMFKKGWSANVTAIQPIFAGGRIVNGNRLAKVGVEASKLETQGAVDKVILAVEEQYWSLATLKSKRQTLESVITMVDTLEAHVAVAVKAGVVNRNDLLKVKLQRSELEALKVDLDNGISLSRTLLAQTVGRDGDSIDIVADSVPRTVPPYPSDLLVDPAKALPQTTDYRLLEQQVKASELRQRMALGENLPTVGLGAGYFYDELLSQKHGFGALMLTVQVPISAWWGGSHNVKKARLATENARTEMSDLSQMLRIKMQDSWDNLTAAHRKMAIASEAIETAEENLRMNRNFYAAGVCTIADLLEAQTLYRQTLDAYTQAYGDFRLQRARYLVATGRS